MRSAENALQLLNCLLENGDLKSSVDEYLTTIMRQGSGSFYARKLEEAGYVAAEQALSEWVEGIHMYEFAGSIEHIAIGMRDIAKVDLESKHVRVLAVDRNMSFSLTRSFEYGATLIALLDLPHHNGCGCDLPKGAEIFGKYGTLPLRAVILGIDPRKKASELALVFPAREKDPGNGDGYTSVIVCQNGRVYNEICFPLVSVSGYLAYSLGLVSAKESLTVSTFRGGSLDDQIGFPGAGEYLAKHISGLGPYLSTISQTLEKKHH